MVQTRDHYLLHRAAVCSKRFWSCYHICKDLEEIIDYMRNWVCPATYRRRTSPELDYVAHCLAISRWLLETRWFTSAGRCRRRTARRRCKVLDPDTIQAMYNAPFLHDQQCVLDWVQVQWILPMLDHEVGHTACYMLFQKDRGYNGSTHLKKAADESGHYAMHLRQKVGAHLWRFWQHVVEIRMLEAKNKEMQESTLLKAKLFWPVLPGQLVSIAYWTAVDIFARTFDFCSNRLWRCVGNSKDVIAATYVGPCIFDSFA